MAVRCWCICTRLGDAGLPPDRCLPDQPVLSPQELLLFLRTCPQPSGMTRTSACCWPRPTASSSPLPTPPITTRSEPRLLTGEALLESPVLPGPAGPRPAPGRAGREPPASEIPKRARGQVLASGLRCGRFHPRPVPAVSLPNDRLLGPEPRGPGQGKWPPSRPFLGVRSLSC